MGSLNNSTIRIVETLECIGVWATGNSMDRGGNDGPDNHSRLNSKMFEGYLATCSPLRSNIGLGDDGECMGHRAESVGWCCFCCGCQFGGA